VDGIGSRMKEVVKVAFIGLGGRGLSLLKSCILRMPEDVEVVAVCDNYKDRTDAGKKAVMKSTRGNVPIASTNYKDVIGLKEVDCVIIATSWEDHIKIAIEAMKLGKFVSMEVGGAYTLQDCYDLVQAYEETGQHCMLLENCNYGEYELMVLNMVKKGLFGEIVFCEGGYMHDLRREISDGEKNRHYRLRNYKSRNCENYPTHEIGPIAKVIKINNGNRFLNLTSFGSKSVGLKDYIKRNRSNNQDLMNTEFKQNDIIVTVLRCHNGETVTIFLDTTLPRYYSRRFTIRGTRGMYMEDGNLVYMDGMPENLGRLRDNGKKFSKKYGHDLWSKKNKKYRKYGHGGMDWFVLRAFIETVKQDAYPPIDVYDTVTYMAITALSQLSLENNSSSVEFPDFTGGKWQNKDTSKILPEFLLD
jgi:Glycosyl hydrolase 109, C-terminal domain/Oxidoreductase family, NAD-binding Rossmann fold